jgi:hypothetical protein
MSINFKHLMSISFDDANDIKHLRRTRRKKMQEFTPRSFLWMNYPPKIFFNTFLAQRNLSALPFSKTKMSLYTAWQEPVAYLPSLQHFLWNSILYHRLRPLLNSRFTPSHSSNKGLYRSTSCLRSMSMPPLKSTGVYSLATPCFM